MDIDLTEHGISLTETIAADELDAAIDQAKLLIGTRFQLTAWTILRCADDRLRSVVELKREPPSREAAKDKLIALLMDHLDDLGDLAVIRPARKLHAEIYQYTDLPR